MDSVITLVSHTQTTNDAGDTVNTPIKKDVFCEVASIGMKEAYTALGVGLNPSIKFIIADYYEFNDEEEIEYEGKKYNVIRTFQNGEQLELTAERVR